MHGYTSGSQKHPDFERLNTEIDGSDNTKLLLHSVRINTGPEWPRGLRRGSAGVRLLVNAGSNSKEGMIVCLL